MIETWLRAAETIAHMAVVKHGRVLGFVSQDSGANVSALVRTVAEVLTRSGVEVVVADFTQPIGEVPLSDRLSAFDGMLSTHEEPAWQTLNTDAGYTRLVAS